ncbi:hypothetical protein NQ317_014675 [Molorchus minor]|uniref:Reverse transcriptase domain-containing protein n=1 Tax=Molorchus minor TaxID=1323400 RepID=A0ABQ9IXH9_9CUCU|nr:hypothetical protein NQ317_014675 [Molorchus minor]
MSSPTDIQVTEDLAIPIKKIMITDPSELPSPSQYSSTPGGTLFSTTPGGSRIVYEKAFMLSLRDCPIAKTPPSYDIPEALKIPERVFCDLIKGLEEFHHPKVSCSGMFQNKVRDNEDQFQLEL